MTTENAIAMTSELLPVLNDEGITLGQLLRVASKAVPIATKYGVTVPPQVNGVLAVLPVLANMAK